MPLYQHQQNMTTKNPVNITIAAAIAAACNLSPDERDAVARAIASRGKHAGRLLARCPADWGPRRDPLAAAAWLGLQPNPWRIFVGRVILQTEEQTLLFSKLAGRPWPVQLDRDAAALSAAGVW